MSVTQLLQDQLKTLSQRDQFRDLQPIAGIDFSSNDYLGLSQHSGIRAQLITALEGGLPLGAGGSRLLRGNHPAHEALEAYAADFFGAEAAMFMATGYLANLALLTTLPQRGDALLLDGLIHASSKEGAHASFAQTLKFAHNDVQSCEAAIRSARAKGAKGLWIAVESVYSMDGDCAPLDDFMALCDRYDAYLIVDEAHGTGVHGVQGRGLSEAYEGRENLIALHTCGKALGQAGALLTLPKIMQQTLINKGRSFIYTTAPSPLAAVAVQAALEVIAEEPERRQALQDRIHLAHRLFPESGTTQPTQILPLILGEEGKAVAYAQALQAQGFDIRAIRTPTVPKGQARLRLSVTLNATSDHVEALAAAYRAL